MENSLKNNLNIELRELNINLDKIKNKINGLNFLAVCETEFEFLKKNFNSTLGLNIMEILTKQNSKDLEILNSLFGIEENVFRYGIIFHNRVERILNYASKNQCSVMMDAEQSYIQSVIDSTAKFYTLMFNKTFCTVLQTIQCYLKSSKKNSEDFLEFVKKYDLKLGVKIVRGAYITEETRLAISNNYENPIHRTIEDTHNDYNSLIPRILNQTTKDDKVNISIKKIIIASHNEESIKYSSKFLNESNAKSVYSAQLVGISEHITILSKQNVKFN